MAADEMFGGQRLSRREAMARTAWTGLGVAAAATCVAGMESLWAQTQQRFDESSARIGWPSVTPLPPVDDRYPIMPTWKTELRQLAPNVYVYQQQGGTGLFNAGISNAGLFVGEEWLVALDALARIIHVFRDSKSLFVVKSRCRRGFNTTREAFA